MSDINKYRKGLVCLVPKRGSEFTMTCHEKTLCDCQVLEIFAAYDSLEAKFALVVEALEFYAADDFPYKGKLARETMSKIKGAAKNEI